MTDEKKRKPGRPLKFDDPVKLQKQIDDYFSSCFTKAFDQFGNPIVDKTQSDYNKDDESTWAYVMKQTKPFTVSGLAAFLDTSRNTLVQYEDYEHFPEDLPQATRDELINTVKRAKEQIYAYAEERLFIPGVATGSIFWLKNNAPDSWKDRHEIGGDGTVTVISKRFDQVDEKGDDKPKEPEGAKTEADS